MWKTLFRKSQTSRTAGVNFMKPFWPKFTDKINTVEFVFTIDREHKNDFKIHKNLR
jgi:hypothetical protein